MVYWHFDGSLRRIVVDFVQVCDKMPLRYTFIVTIWTLEFCLFFMMPFNVALKSHEKSCLHIFSGSSLQRWKKCKRNCSLFLTVSLLPNVLTLLSMILMQRNLFVTVRRWVGPMYTFWTTDQCAIKDKILLTCNLINSVTYFKVFTFNTWPTDVTVNIGHLVSVSMRPQCICIGEHLSTLITWNRSFRLLMNLLSKTKLVIHEIKEFYHIIK